MTWSIVSSPECECEAYHGYGWMWLLDVLLRLDPHSNSAVMHYNTPVWLPAGHRDASAVSFQDPSCISASLRHYRGRAVVADHCSICWAQQNNPSPAAFCQKLFLAVAGTSRECRDTRRLMMLHYVTLSSCLLIQMMMTIIENRQHDTCKQQVFEFNCSFRYMCFLVTY